MIAMLNDEEDLYQAISKNKEEAENDALHIMPHSPEAS